MTEDRKPDGVYGVGDEPDPRFSLANERTALSSSRAAQAGARAPSPPAI